MKVFIDYHAAYTYAEKVSLSPHRARVIPRGDLFTRILDQSFQCSGNAVIQFQRDLFDHITACCFFPEETHAFEISFQCQLQLTPRNPLDFLLDSRALTLPPTYSDAEHALLQPYLATPFPVTLPPPLAPVAGRPTVETLMQFLRWMHEHIAYERREEGAPMPPDEFLSRGKGSCRDFMALMSETLRQNGLAARLVSGYLWQGSDVEHRVSDNALHAWVEAFLPGAGWIALDPTNGVFCDHTAIATATGLRPEDIAPVSGAYFGLKTIPSQLATRLTIKEV